MLIGPSTILPLFQPNEGSVILATVIGFVGLGFIMIPIPQLLTDTLQDYGFPNELETNALVAGVYNGLWYFGAFLGPTVAGVMVESMGFRSSSTVMAFLAAFIMVLLIFTSIFMRSEYWKAKGQFRYALQASSSFSSTYDESIPSDSSLTSPSLNETGEVLDHLGELRNGRSVFGRNDYGSFQALNNTRFCDESV